MGGMFSQPAAAAAAVHDRPVRSEARQKEVDDLCHLLMGLKNRRLSEDEKNALKVDPQQWALEHEFPFTNLVMEGGGNKGLAYVGALQCLEDCGIAPNITRLAGASAGAISALMAALGYSAQELKAFMMEDGIKDLFVDHSGGLWSLLPNLLMRLGWNPAHKAYHWFGQKIAAKSKEGNPDMTFWDLYMETGRELCVVVANVNLSCAQLCHAKTTPHVKLRDAVRASMAIPYFFQPWTIKAYVQEDLFVDGGTLLNYPVQAWDGWWLSMDPEDRFSRRLRPLSELNKLRHGVFDGANARTLGLLLYDDSERDTMRYSLMQRPGANEPAAPARDTRLWTRKSQHRDRHMDTLVEAHEHHEVLSDAIEVLMRLVRREAKEGGTDAEPVTQDRLAQALDNPELSAEMKQLLFGDDASLATAILVKKLLPDDKPPVTFLQLLYFLEAKGAKIREATYGYGRREVSDLKSFASALNEAKYLTLADNNVKDSDVGRTVGINTGYVSTLDFDLEEEDVDFVIARGYNACRAFLQQWVVTEASKTGA